MREAIVEPTLTQDVLEVEVVRKPALLRALFEVGAVYSAQELSYRKLLGQLDDRGNTDTIAHYLELLSRAGLLSGLPKYDEKVLKERASSPRLLPMTPRSWLPLLANGVNACARTAIEVKSGRVKSLKGLGEFVQRYPGTYALVIGSNEFPVDDFLLGRVSLFQ